MNIRELAELDLELTLEDNENGYGWPLRVTAPDSTFLDMFGQSGDIEAAIDPDTGQLVSGRVAHLTLRKKTLIDKFGEIPVAVNKNSTNKPWVFDFDDINGVAGKFTVQKKLSDSTLGIVNYLLEVYVS